VVYDLYETALSFYVANAQIPFLFSVLCSRWLSGGLVAVLTFVEHDGQNAFAYGTTICYRDDIWYVDRPFLRRCAHRCAATGFLPTAKLNDHGPANDDGQSNPGRPRYALLEHEPAEEDAYYCEYRHVDAQEL
jgi:hypothetical protein